MTLFKLAFGCIVGFFLFDDPQICMQLAGDFFNMVNVFIKIVDNEIADTCHRPGPEPEVDLLCFMRKV